MDIFLHSNCTSPEQECILLQPDVGVDGEKETTATIQQAAIREEFARRSGSNKRRQHGLPIKASNLTGVDQQRNHFFSEERGVFCRMHYRLLVFLVYCLLSTVVFFLLCPQLTEAGTKDDESDWDVPDA